MPRFGICTGLALIRVLFLTGVAERTRRHDRSCGAPGRRETMSTDLADRIRTEIAALRSEIEAERVRAKRNVENVAAEAEIAQRLRALRTRLDELERNLEQCPPTVQSNSQA